MLTEKALSKTVGSDANDTLLGSRGRPVQDARDALRRQRMRDAKIDVNAWREMG